MTGYWDNGEANVETVLKIIEYIEITISNPNELIWDLNILVLDDVLIGLDMSNRLPVINILHDHFQHYQTFFMTYDREWYNIMKQKIEASDTSDNWLYLELFYSRIDDDLEIPVFAQDKDYPVFAQDKNYLAKAKEYLNANDFKAAAIYLRTAFEVLIKKFCEKKELSVLYKEEQRKLTINNFLKPIKEGKKDRNGNRLPYISEQLERDIDQYLSGSSGFKGIRKANEKDRLII